MERPRNAAKLVETGMRRSRGTLCRLVCRAFSVCLVCSVLVFAGDAKASRGYACNDKPCSDERKTYVENSARRACALSRALDRALKRKAREEQMLADLVARLNRCLARRRGHCQYLALRVMGMNRRIAATQRSINSLVARAQASCRVSLPNGVPGNPPTCEETEASNYCPIANEQQALQSLQQRCADLEAEKLQQALCDNCNNQNIIVAASLGSGNFAQLAAGVPSVCDPSFEEPVPVATPVPEQINYPIGLSGPNEVDLAEIPGR